MGEKDWTIIAAVNNEQVLKSCLLNSPGIRQAAEVLLQSGYPSAAAAYNAAIAQAKTEVLIFLHQDMYLPEGWDAQVSEALAALAKDDPAWGVLGVWGITRDGGRAGHIYCTAGRRMLRGPSDGYREVTSLDEVVLILRKSSGLHFDERLPGFHLYGADICLEALSRGMKCYALPAFCIHNSNGYRMLPVEFWRNYLFMRNKWRAHLPVTTSCAEITASCWPTIWWNIRQAASVLTGRCKVGKRVPDPAQLCRELMPVPAARETL